MENAERENVRFNPTKLQYRKPVVKFLGMLWSLNSIKIDPGRIQAIQALKEPRTRKELQRRLGVFNHLRKFIPQMAEIAAPLYELLSQNVIYQWLPVHSQAFQKLKDSVQWAPGIIPYDSAKTITVQADASQSGLGACLLQGGRLVTSASRKMTQAEQNYAQVEKEMLALVYAAEKFERFIYGMPKVLFQTDHQPLVSIFKKALHTITNNRLKKMRLKMLKYQPKVEYLPGKEMYLADLLSRDYLDSPVDDDPDMLEVVHEVTLHLAMSEEIAKDFRAETEKDTGLKAVINYYQNGWPNDKNQIEPEALQYWKIRHELFVEDGMVIMGDRVVVPEVLRRKVLTNLHLAHLGKEKTKARARQVVYWPWMNNDIDSMVAECRTCERNQTARPPEPLLPHEVPELPFQKVSIDLFEFNGLPHLVIVDNLSKWLEIKKLLNKSSKAVIDALREVFSTHGIPEVIMGDNNPLNSYECHEYARSIGSAIVTSSPYYPRSNGLAEKAVGIAERIMLKCSETGTHYLDGLREYNNTPLTGLKESPAQILMSRMCRTVVPTLRSNLKPKVSEVRDQLIERQEQKKVEHDRKAIKKAKTFNLGELVVVRRERKWEKAKVIRKHSAPRSYIIRLENGREIRRNSWHLMLSKSSTDRHDLETIPMDFETPVVCPQAQKRVVNPRAADLPENLVEEGPGEILEVPEPHRGRQPRRRRRR